MKKYLILTTFLVACFFAKGQKTNFFIEQQTYFGKDASPSAFVWANKDYKNNTGVFVFALASHRWGEILLGPKHSFISKRNPNRFLEVGVGAGIEADKTPIRGGVYYFFSTAPTKARQHTLQSLGFVEYGGSGYWYVWFGTYNVSNSIAVGLHAQSFNGVVGPRLQFQRRSFMAYVVAGRNLELKEKGGLLGLRLYF